MENISIFRRISLIHTVKCNKTISMNTAIESFNTLSYLKGLIENSQTDDLKIVNEKVVEWQNQKPVVTDYDLNHLLNSKRNG